MHRCIVRSLLILNGHENFRVILQSTESASVVVITNQQLEYVAIIHSNQLLVYLEKAVQITHTRLKVVLITL